MRRHRRSARSPHPTPSTAWPDPHPSRTDREEPAHARLRSRHRPRHDQHPLHDLRPRRQRGGPPPARARADHAPGRLGGARPRGDLDTHPGGRPARPWTTPGSTAGGPGRPRAHQPARDHRGLEPVTGQPYYNAIVWQDTRTDRIAAELDRDGHGDLIRRRPGLPPVDLLRRRQDGHGCWRTSTACARRADAGDALFGTIDTWLLWNLTGGHRRRPAPHRRDQRQPHHADEPRRPWTGTTSCWTSSACRGQMLPRIVPSARPEHYGQHPDRRPVRRRGAPSAAPSATSMPPWSARSAWSTGEAKNTYGTGNFLLLNTGPEIVRSTNGLLTTVCYQFGDEPAMYALEGSIAVTGSAVQWLRDQLGIISRRERDRGPGQPGARHRRRLLRPGLLRAVRALLALRRPRRRSSACPASTPRPIWPAPRWRRSATRAATWSQAMEADSGVRLDVLKVDGGVTANELCMQIQADTLGVEVSRPVVAETTALGRGVRGRAGRRLLGASPDELRAALAGGPALDPADHVRAAGRGVRRLAEGRTTHARLGGRLIDDQHGGSPQHGPPVAAGPATATWPWSWSGPPRRRRSTAPAISAAATRTRSTRPRSTRCGRCSARSG